MNIKSIYRKYVQKSRLFLYPVLDIKRGVSVTPIQTYLSWSGKYSVADSKFICVYHLRDDMEFRIFEEQKLLDNPLFEEFFELEDDKGVYVFDFSERDQDFWNVVTGKYSELSQKHKNKIIAFFKKQRSHSAYIESYLYPTKYFSMYSEMLTQKAEDAPAMERLLRKVGQLCDPPDLEKENLVSEVKQLDIKPIGVNLSDNQQQNPS